MVLAVGIKLALALAEMKEDLKNIVGRNKEGG